MISTRSVVDSAMTLVMASTQSTIR
jgi:hypothetical protein